MSRRKPINCFMQRDISVMHGGKLDIDHIQSATSDTANTLECLTYAKLHFICNGHDISSSDSSYDYYKCGLRTSY